MREQGIYFWQEDSWAQLAGRAEAGRLPHAVLLSGAKGLGKSSLASRFANWLLCEADNKPCGQCKACQQFTAGTHPDFRWIKPIEDKQTILVEQIRELGQFFNQTVSRGGLKIAVIEPADAMNANAANSLLKTLEEPAAGSLLLLVSSKPAFLSATIRSRCQQVVLSAPDVARASEWLAHGNAEDAAVVLAHCGGAPLAARELLDADFPGMRNEFVLQIRGITSGTLDPVTVAESWLTHPVEALEWLTGWTRDLIRLKQVGSAEILFNPDCTQDLQTVAERIHLISLHKYLAALGEGSRLLRTTVNLQLLLESLLIPWAFNLDPPTVEQLA